MIPEGGLVGGRLGRLRRAEWMDGSFGWVCPTAALFDAMRGYLVLGLF